MSSVPQSTDLDQGHPSFSLRERTLFVLSVLIGILAVLFALYIYAAIYAPPDFWRFFEATAPPRNAELLVSALYFALGGVAVLLALAAICWLILSENTIVTVIRWALATGFVLWGLIVLVEKQGWGVTLLVTVLIVIVLKIYVMLYVIFKRQERMEESGQ